MNEPRDPAANTRREILKAARKVFSKYGYSGARMQQIADESGMNKALLHYHFRNKETLYGMVFKEALDTLKNTIFDVLNTDKPLFDKIRIFCTEYISMLQENRFFVGFVAMELNHNPDKLLAYFKESGIRPPEVFLHQINEEIRNETIMPIQPHQLIINIMAMSAFPFIGRPIIKGVMGMDDTRFEAIIEERKKMVPEWIIASIEKHP
jgi:AcrR family transcriptional regulator